MRVSIWPVLNTAVLIALGMVGILFLLWPQQVQERLHDRERNRLHQRPRTFQVGKLALHIGRSAPPSASQLRRSGWFIVAVTFIGLAIALAG